VDARQLGFTLTDRIPEPMLDQDRENLCDLHEVIRALDQLAIPYALGGSMASSFYGIDRDTRDGDITVEPFAGLITAKQDSAKVEQLSADFAKLPDAASKGLLGAIRNVDARVSAVDFFGKSKA
jgi:hypothetical protein